MKFNMTDAEVGLLGGLIQHFGSSDVGSSCRPKCLQVIQPVIDKARHLLHDVFQNKFCCPTANKDVMARYVELEFTVGLEQANAVLGSVPGNELMAKELVMLQYVVALLKQTSTIALDRLTHESRQERKMSAERVKLVSQARLTLKMAMATYAELSVDEKKLLFRDRARAVNVQLVGAGTLCKAGAEFKQEHV